MHCACEAGGIHSPVVQCDREKYKARAVELCKPWPYLCVTWAGQVQEDPPGDSGWRENALLLVRHCIQLSRLTHARVFGMSGELNAVKLAILYLQLKTGLRTTSEAFVMGHAIRSDVFRCILRGPTHIVYLLLCIGMPQVGICCCQHAGSDDDDWWGCGVSRFRVLIT